MKLLNVALVAVSTCAVVCVGYFTTLTALLVRALNESNEEGEKEEV